MAGKREAKRKVVELVLKKGKAWPNWTNTDHEENCQFFASV